MFFFQETDDYPFNFISMGADSEKSFRDARKNRKRTNEDDAVLYSYVKKPMKKGVKLIKIEIYDVETLKKTEEFNQNCNCTADLCMQHVVQSLLFDDVYMNVKEIMSKIENSLLNQ